VGSGDWGLVIGDWAPQLRDASPHGRDTLSRGCGPDAGPDRVGVGMG